MRIPPHKAGHVIASYKKRMTRKALGLPLSGDIDPSVFTKKTDAVLENAARDMAGRLLKQMRATGQAVFIPVGQGDASGKSEGIIGEALFEFNTINGDSEKISGTLDPKSTIDYEDPSG